MTLTKSDISDQASKLYRKYGIRSVTMSDIASELGISKKTLYQHITDKETLVDLVLALEFSNMDTALNKVMEEFTHPIIQFIEIQNTILSILVKQSGAIGYELKKYYPEKYNYYLDTYISLFITTLKQNLSNGVEQGIYRKNLDAEIIVKTHIAAFLNVRENKLIELHDYLSAEHATETLRYHLRAIVSKEHIDSIDNYLETIKPQLP